MRLSIALIPIAIVVLGAEGVRILAVFPFQAKSHYSVYEPLLKRLTEKGHEVVSITHFPQKTNVANFTDVNITSSVPPLVGNMSLEIFKGLPKWLSLSYLVQRGGTELCTAVLNHPEVTKIVRSKEKFDVLIVEIFVTDCFLGIAHSLKIPTVVGAISSVALPWSNQILGSPENPSYIPNWVSSFSDRMNFFERTLNSMNFLLAKHMYRYLSDKPSYEIAKQYFGDDLPDLDSLRSKISLILTNGHRTVSAPRALAPGVIEVGGIHIPVSGPAPLPKNLQDYLNSQDKDGVIYFSLGSQVNSSTMHEQALDAFFRAFEKVPQQILLKCSEEKMPRLPKNVKCIKWAPQLSVLCHPNLRLFITHGGLLGTQEAVYCGVPILGMPLFGDQHLNMAYFVKKGLALQLDYYRLSYELVSNALNELLANKSYTEVARKASLQFRDRPIPPLEEAAYWIEYLIRHGPDSLKTEATNLAWYQYLLLDVILATTVSILLVIWVVYKLLILVCRRKKTESINSCKKHQ